MALSTSPYSLPYLVLFCLSSVSCPFSRIRLGDPGQPVRLSPAAWSPSQRVPRHHPLPATSPRHVTMPRHHPLLKSHQPRVCHVPVRMRPHCDNASCAESCAILLPRMQRVGTGDLAVISALRNFSLSWVSRPDPREETRDRGQTK